ncbi:IS110-like element ISPpu10 family transposase, partial [Pseudomonas putida]
MAMSAIPIEAGVDTSKDELVIQAAPNTKSFAIPNTPKAIKAWLKTLPKGSALAIEATSTYHMEMAEQAHAAGFAVYVIDGLRLSKYRESVAIRAKTDAHDAALLARFLSNERGSLKAWTPPPAGHREIQVLLRRRAKLVAVRGMLRMSLSGDKLFASELKRVEEVLERIELSLEKQLRAVIKKAGLSDQMRRVQRLPGVGFLTAAGLVMSFM